MRELTVRIRFNQHCLGNVKGRRGNFFLPRDVEEAVVFMPTWHLSNMQLAASIYGRHQTEVRKIHWDPRIDVVLLKDRWYRRTFSRGEGKSPRIAFHEAILPHQVIGINCAVPDSITDDHLISLMTLAGKYKGLSPYKPGQFGRFTVEALRRRRCQPEKVVRCEDDTPQ